MNMENGAVPARPGPRGIILRRQVKMNRQRSMKELAQQAGTVVQGALGQSVVVVVGLAGESDRVRQCLARHDQARLVTYRHCEELMYCVPAGPVSLIVVDTYDPPPVTELTVEWLRHCWPDTLLCVIGEADGLDQELSARKGGALYLARPVPLSQWEDLLGHVLSKRRHVFP